MSKQNSKVDNAKIESAMADTAKKLQAARDEVGKVVFGQDKVLDRIFITLLSGGHVLLIGVFLCAGKQYMIDSQRG